MGVRHENVIVCDRAGPIYPGRENVDQWKSAHAVETPHRSLEEACQPLRRLVHDQPCAEVLPLGGYADGAVVGVAGTHAETADGLDRGVGDRDAVGARAVVCTDLNGDHASETAPMIGVSATARTLDVADEKAIEELDMPQTDIRVAVRETYQWFQENGYVG